MHIMVYEKITVVCPNCYWMFWEIGFYMRLCINWKKHAIHGTKDCCSYSVICKKVFHLLADLEGAI